MANDKGVRLARYEETLNLNPHGRKKMRCPSCGSLSFIPYVISESGAAVDLQECGRCDHQESCGYHLTPSQYWQKYPERNPIQKMTPEQKAEARENERKRIAALRHEAQLLALREINSQLEQVQDSGEQEPSNIQEKASYSPSKAISRIPWEIVSRTEQRALETNFYRFLCRHFKADVIKRVFEMYHIGADKFGRVVFWQIDNLNEVRAGKIMQYADNGHRAKNPDGTPLQGATNWVHSVLLKHGQLPQEWKLDQCLFGAHLLTLDDLPCNVCLVEAEKSAIIGACAFPEFIWVATGGKYNLKASTLAPLIDYTNETQLGVQVFADLGSRDDWERRLEPLADILPYSLSDLLERNATPKAIGKGMDIADLICGEF